MVALLFGILAGVIVFVLTSAVLGAQRSFLLPGGALVAALAVKPLYFSIPGALLGHVLAIVICRTLKLDYRGLLGLPQN